MRRKTRNHRLNGLNAPPSTDTSSSRWIIYEASIVMSAGAQTSWHGTGSITDLNQDTHTDQTHRMANTRTSVYNLCPSTGQVFLSTKAEERHAERERRAVCVMSLSQGGESNFGKTQAWSSFDANAHSTTKKKEKEMQPRQNQISHLAVMILSFNLSCLWITDQ